MKKITIIGAGNVGMTVAYTLATKNICNEIALIDIDEDRVLGCIYDIQDAVSDFDIDINVHEGKYKDLDNTDILVVTVGGRAKSGDKDRLAAFEDAMRISKLIATEINKTKFNGIVISVGNPADLVAHKLMRELNIDNKKVISTGTYLDSIRLRGIISRKLKIDISKVSAFVFGEHGESQFPAFSMARIEDKSIYDFFSKADMEEAYEKTRNRGWEIYRRLNLTQYGIAQSVCSIIDKVYNGCEEYIPISVNLTGQYGESDVHISTLAKIDKEGVCDILEVNFDEHERKLMKNSILKLKKFSDRI